MLDATSAHLDDQPQQRMAAGPGFIQPRPAALYGVLLGVLRGQQRCSAGTADADEQRGVIPSKGAQQGLPHLVEGLQRQGCDFLVWAGDRAAWELNDDDDSPTAEGGRLSRSGVPIVRLNDGLAQGRL